MSFVLRPNARQWRGRCRLSGVGGRSSPGHRPDGHLAHVHLGQAREAPRVADGDHRHRAVAPRDHAAALEGSTARSTSMPPRPPGSRSRARPRNLRCRRRFGHRSRARRGPRASRSMRRSLPLRRRRGRASARSRAPPPRSPQQMPRSRSVAIAFTSARARARSGRARDRSHGRRSLRPASSRSPGRRAFAASLTR